MGEDFRQIEDLPRACGHVQPFGWWPNDPRAGERRERARSRPCGPCRQAEHNARQKVEATGRREQRTIEAVAHARGGQVVRYLPRGATVTLTRLDDRNWSGTLTAGGTEVRWEGPGLHRTIIALARHWLDGQDARVIAEANAVGS